MRYDAGAAALVLATVVWAAALRAEESILGLPEAAMAGKGSLLIVGGGRTTDDIRREFIRLAGGRQARIVLIPSAGEFESLDEIKEYFSVWRQFDVASLDFLDAHSRGEADSAEFIRALQCATGVWMPGGRQDRLMRLYGGTLAERAIRQILERGGVVGGTSAGAAVMSRVMIVEGSYNDVVTSRGFGLLDGAVVDQHFSQRSRHARLLKVLEQNPGLLGLGVDEQTALVVCGNRLRVVGESRVIVCIPTESQRATVVHRIRPGEEVELVLPGAAAREIQMRVALRRPAG